MTLTEDFQAIFQLTGLRMTNNVKFSGRLRRHLDK